MMIEKIGAKNLKSSCRMMIEKVMIQLGMHFNRKGWRRPREELAMLRMQEAKAKHQLGKHQSQKAAKSQKATCPQRNWQCRGCEKRRTVNADDAK